MPDIEKNRHISRCDEYVSFCTGCASCELVCGLVHEGYCSPTNHRIELLRHDVTCRHEIFTCQNCADPACYNACPLQDTALCYDEELQVAYVNADECIGCGLCVQACPFEPKRIHVSPDGKAIKCDLCRGREEGPACIEYCQAMVLGFSGEQVPDAEEGVCYE